MLLFVFLTCLLSAAAAEDTAGVSVVPGLRGQTVELQCTAKEKPGVQYVAVRWYKEGVAPRLTGLLTKDLPDGRMRWFVGASTQISLVQHTLNLQLPNVSCSHRGVYQCYLAAPVGQQNREGRVRLTVSDCPTDVEQTPVTAEQKVKDSYLHALVAGLVLIIALGIFALTYKKKFRNVLWTKTKTSGKAFCPVPSSLTEKQELDCAPSSKHSKIIA